MGAIPQADMAINFYRGDASVAYKLATHQFRCTCRYKHKSYYVYRINEPHFDAKRERERERERRKIKRQENEHTLRNIGLYRCNAESTAVVAVIPASSGSYTGGDQKMVYPYLQWRRHSGSNFTLPSYKKKQQIYRTCALAMTSSTHEAWIQVTNTITSNVGMATR